MTTDPIAAARAMIEPLTGYTPGPWSVSEYDGTGYVYGPAQGYDDGFDLEDARLIATAPDMRDMIATLADALEAEQAEVAAAYEVAAKYIQSHDQSGVNCNWRGMADTIRDLTPADAQAALNKTLAEARLKGWRAGRDAATEPLTSLAAVLRESENSYHQSQATAMLERADAIRALPEPKETNHD